MQNIRLLAVKALTGILSKDSRPKHVLDSFPQSLDRRDRGFLMEVVYGVLRNRDTIDWILEHFLKKPQRLGDPTVHNLRAAVYQIYFMNVPDWAAVNEAVETEKASGAGRVAVVNAVLRNILRQRERFAPPFSFDDPVEEIAVNTSHPRWLVKRWVRRFGNKEAYLLAKANNLIPPMTLRVNTLRTTRRELLSMFAERDISAVPTDISPDGITLKDSLAFDELAFARGLFVVQDEASQLISRLLGPLAGERVLDTCAAPGGKTTHIAQLMSDAGEVIAVEKDADRAGLLRENIECLGIKSVKIIRADINGLKDPAAFDRVLLDAPCSATGVIRRNPDVKYRRKAGDLAGYRSIQLQLLNSASRLLKDGGRLVYSVCSIEPEEGEQVVAAFLKTSGEFRIIDAEVSDIKSLMQNGFFKTYPHRNSMDGFFGAVLCKKG